MTTDFDLLRRNKIFQPSEFPVMARLKKTVDNDA
jgi:hypothetical protein